MDSCTAHVKLWNSLEDSRPSENGDFLSSMNMTRIVFIRSYVNKIEDSSINQFAEEIAKRDLMPLLLNLLFQHSNGSDELAEEISWIFIGLFTANADKLNLLCSEKLFGAFDFLLQTNCVNVLENVSSLAFVGGLQPSEQQPLRQKHIARKKFL